MEDRSVPEAGLSLVRPGDSDAVRDEFGRRKHDIIFASRRRGRNVLFAA